MSPANAAFSAYNNAEIGTLTQRDLIVKLYQGAERFLAHAAIALDNKEMETALGQGQKAKRIFVELLSTLNFDDGGDIAPRLRDLYLYFVSEITEGLLKSESNKLRDILPIVANLREAWQEIPAEFANVSGLEDNGGHSVNLRT